MVQNQNNPPIPFNQYKEPFGLGQIMTLKLMSARLGNYQKPHYYPDNPLIEVEQDMNNHLETRGGYSQQERMIRDKRKSFDHACLYSYQGALVKKIQDGGCLGEYIGQVKPARALINPDKTTCNKKKEQPKIRTFFKKQ